MQAERLGAGVVEGSVNGSVHPAVRTVTAVQSPRNEIGDAVSPFLCLS
jgi:hypothetical protein